MWARAATAAAAISNATSQVKPEQLRSWQVPPGSPGANPHSYLGLRSTTHAAKQTEHFQRTYPEPPGKLGRRGS